MNTKYYVLIGCIAPLSIFIYGKYRCHNADYKDPLETKLLLGLDGWSLTHFVLFLILGYLFPTYYWISFSFGFLWELFEHLVGKYRPRWLVGKNGCVIIKGNTEADDSNWWYGKSSDLIMNGLGLIVGVYLSKK